jgi:thiol:disulfide interchange protein DsbC
MCSRSVIAVLLSAVSFCSFAEGVAPDSVAVRSSLIKNIPSIEGHVVSVKKLDSSLPGLFEVVTDDRQIIYVDKGANYIITGQIIKTKGMVDLTGQRLAEINVIKFDELPLGKAIKRVHGKGERKLAIFSDPDCPYCQALETDLSKVDNVTIYTFPFPIETLHPEANLHATEILCSPDPAKAWDNYLLHKTLPGNARDSHCDAHLDELLALGQKYHVSGTPTVVFADGHIVPGSMSAEDINRQLGGK